MSQLYDNTRLKDHRICPRFFYFRHRLHLTTEVAKPALAFGLGWHAAMDRVWDGVRSQLENKTIVENAMRAFLHEWVKAGFPDWDAMTDDDFKMLAPRTPDTAYDMINHYLAHRRDSFLEGIEVLDIERPFAVPLFPDDPDVFYVGRLDKVFRWNGRIWVGEHKTTSLYKRDGGFRHAWIEQFQLSSQVDGYIHAVKMIYGETAAGVMIDGALVHRKERAFTWIPIERHPDALNSWLWNAQERVRRIADDDRNLSAHVSDRAVEFLPAYPQNTESCVQYGSTCAYLNLCKNIQDPSRITDKPMNYVQERWEPFQFHRLSEIGLEPES